MPVRNNGNKEGEHIRALITYMQCAWCGDIVPIGTLGTWAYKYRAEDGMHYFCGWNCMRKCQKANPQKKSLKWPKLTVTWKRPIE